MLRSKEARLKVCQLAQISLGLGCVGDIIEQLSLLYILQYIVGALDQGFFGYGFNISKLVEQVGAEQDVFGLLE